jgi:hypothetical protein
MKVLLLLLLCGVETRSGTGEFKVQFYYSMFAASKLKIEWATYEPRMSKEYWDRIESELRYIFRGNMFSAGSSSRYRRHSYDTIYNAHLRR